MVQVQLVVRPDPMEVGRARHWARARLAWSGMAADAPCAETVVMLVSELVTNAVVHTHRPAELLLCIPEPACAAGPLRIEVVDTSSRPPRQRHAEGDETHGRGLELVAGLADRWGWQPEGAGKRIWCEVDRGVPESGGCATGGALLAGACEHSRAVTNSP